MAQTKTVLIKDNPQVSNTTDWMIVIAAGLGFLKLVLEAAIGIDLGENSVDAVVDAIAAAAVAVGIWKKPFLTKKDKQKKEVIQQIENDPNTNL